MDLRELQDSAEEQRIKWLNHQGPAMSQDWDFNGGDLLYSACNKKSYGHFQALGYLTEVLGRVQWHGPGLPQDKSHF